MAWGSRIHISKFEYMEKRSPPTIANGQGGWPLMDGSGEWLGG